jgi:hypothetical protein
MGFGTEFLDEITSKGSSGKPSNIDMIYYLFWEKGIDYDRFKNLPIPYIFKIIQTHNWVKSEEEKAYKKANRK